MPGSSPKPARTAFAFAGTGPAILGAFLLLTASKRGFSDAWFCIQTGDDILGRGLPWTNTSTLFGAGRTWIDGQWLGHIALARAYQTLGMSGVVAVTVVVVAVSLAFVAGAQLKDGENAPRVLFAQLCAAAVLANVATPRAQTLAIPLLLGGLHLACKYLRGHGRSYWYALPVVALWGNIHGSAALGACALGGAGLWCEVTGGTNRRLRFVFGFARLALPLTMLAAGPYGWRAFEHYTALLGNAALPEYVPEWRSPLLAPDLWLLALLAVLSAIASLRTVRDGLRSETLLIAISALATLFAARYAVLLGASLAIGGPGLLRGTNVFSSAHSGSRLWSWLPRCAFAAFTASAALHLMTFEGRFAQDAPTRALHAVGEKLAPDELAFVTESAAHRLLLLHPQVRGRISHDCRLELLTKHELSFVAGVRSARAAALERLFVEFDLALIESGDHTTLRAMEQNDDFHRVSEDSAYTLFRAVRVSAPSER